MNERPIGVIDSGMGGLTVAMEIMRQLPHEELLYLGDIARCPYGDRAKEEIIKYTNELVSYLLNKNIKMLVIACNTATAYTYQILERKLNIPVVGVIQPGARAAIKNTKNKNIGVIGTKATIKSNTYANTLLAIDSNLNIKSKACPSFVPLIEQGIFVGENMNMLIDDYLGEIKEEIDTLILGCTHYPFISPSIENYLGENITVVSSSEETAREVSLVLDLLKLKSTKKNAEKYKFYITGNSISFKKTLLFLFDKHSIPLSKLDFFENIKIEEDSDCIKGILQK